MDVCLQPMDVLKYIWARLVPVWQIWFTTGLCPQGAPHCWGKRRNKDQNLTLCKCLMEAAGGLGQRKLRHLGVLGAEVRAPPGRSFSRQLGQGTP